MKNQFSWRSKVRDDELDSYGIVNHATFINYLEQGRNDYARSLGIDFIQLHHEGFNLVVARIEILYLTSLKAQDEFYVTARLSSFNEKRVYFKQEIRLIGDKLAAKALVAIACVDRHSGKVLLPEKLQQLLPIDKLKE